ncbi:MAG: hypothetical protein J7L04_04985 [Bacteroidales bacterium]|nr:hypothetical protein [Bacteroidales bacterium]
MSNLEKYIQENKESFENEPLSGHFDRFSNKLDSLPAGKKISFFPRLMKVAAIAVLIILSSLWTYEKVFQQTSKDGIALGDVSPEYKEVEQYYQYQINVKYGEMNSAHLFTDSIQKRMVLNELSEMDSIYNCMKKDLKTNPNDERVINAMIEHYRLKVEVMNNLLEQLQKLQTNQKQISHENNEI